jgi:hypothetical protein
MILGARERTPGKEVGVNAKIKASIEATASSTLPLFSLGPCHPIKTEAIMEAANPLYIVRSCLIC